MSDLRQKVTAHAEHVRFMRKCTLHTRDTRAIVEVALEVTGKCARTAAHGRVRASSFTARAGWPMRLKLYCNRYAHFKDALVCSVNCVYRTRCQDFALFYDEHRDSVDALVADYYAARREPQSTSPRSLRALPNIASITRC